MPTRIAQGRRVGGLEPKVHPLGVAGQFGQVVEWAENARRGRRACPTASLGAHQAMASTRRARRWRKCPSRRPRRRSGKCSNSLRSKFERKRNKIRQPGGLDQIRFFDTVDDRSDIYFICKSSSYLSSRMHGRTQLGAISDRALASCEVPPTSGSRSRMHTCMHA